MALLLASALFLAGCATPPRPTAANAEGPNVWTGRMSLQVQSDPPQSFSAGFELKGDPVKGELTLNSPLGNALGVARWAPGQASLNTGQQTRDFASIDDLLEQTTGAAVPLSALFDWLQGKNTMLNGWMADLSRQAAGRITAKRLQPQPASDLRIVLDP